ncbi:MULTISPECIES: nuclear transport factor 2 family protein [unclassified Streptomyces]|uniref:nuclear transport factor 2 family protein n=1 Tax=unclassified Streptomyces TaxID=2593676 RepID=UPI0037F8BC2A
MSGTSRQYAVGKAFHSALAEADWGGLRALLHDDVAWTLPGDSAISGTARGPDEVAGLARRIAGYGLRFELLHILVSRDNVALSLHNTARRDDSVLDEHVATVLALRDGKVARIESFLSDVDGVNAFFV